MSYFKGVNLTLDQALGQPLFAQILVGFVFFDPVWADDYPRAVLFGDLNCHLGCLSLLLVRAFLYLSFDQLVPPLIVG